MAVQRQRRQRRHHGVVLLFTILAVSCKTDPRLVGDDAGAVLAARVDAAGADGGDAAHEAGPALDATSPAPPPTVTRHGGRDLEEQPPPQAKSTVPTSWSDGEDLLVHGRSDCNAVLKREWVRITCPNAASVALLGGSVDGVMLDVHEPPPDPHAAETFGRPPRNLMGVAVFPVRRGDRRLFQFNLFSQGAMNAYESSPDSVTPGPVLSEVWLDGEKGPRLEAD
jgi:hypothetical protein